MEFFCVFIDDCDIFLVKFFELFCCYFIERRGEIDEVDVGEEFGDIDVCRYSFDIEVGVIVNLLMDLLVYGSIV